MPALFIIAKRKQGRNAKHYKNVLIIIYRDDRISAANKITFIMGFHHMEHYDTSKKIQDRKFYSILFYFYL